MAGAEVVTINENAKDNVPRFVKEYFDAWNSLFSFGAWLILLYG
jgi:hypothetical protein